MSEDLKIHFVASQVDGAEEALASLAERYGDSPLDEAEVIVALGGDGFMLRTLHRFLPSGLPVYGMKLGNVGFLMNRYRSDELQERLEQREQELEELLNSTSWRITAPMRWLKRRLTGSD